MNQPQPMDLCPGGKEITLYGVRKKCFEPEWLDAETMIYVLEDDLKVWVDGDE